MIGHVWDGLAWWWHRNVTCRSCRLTEPPFTLRDALRGQS